MGSGKGCGGERELPRDTAAGGDRSTRLLEVGVWKGFVLERELQGDRAARRYRSRML